VAEHTVVDLLHTKGRNDDKKCTGLLKDCQLADGNAGIMVSCLQSSVQGGFLIFGLSVVRVRVVLAKVNLRRVVKGASIDKGGRESVL
jgi:hypothetical protein